MTQVVFSTNTVPTQRGFNNTFSQPKNGWYMPVANIEEEKKKKSHKFGIALAVTALIAGFGTLAIMKGSFPKQITKYLEKWKLKLEKKSAKGGQLESFYRYSLNKVESFIGKSQSVNNFTSLKDVLFQKLMFGKDGKRTFTRKIHEGVTRIFDKLSRKTVHSSYASTNSRFAALNEYIIAVNEKILKNNSSNSLVVNKVGSVNKRMASVNKTLEKGFGINARNERLEDMKKATGGLFDYFWNASFKDIKNFKSKNMWQSFIAEDYLVPAKNKLSNETGKLRQIITHDINDDYKAVTEVFDNIQNYLHPTDKHSNQILNSLRSNISKYRRLSGPKEIAERQELNDKILSELKKFSETYKSANNNEDSIKAVLESVNKVENIISQSTKGELQEILTIYKSILPRNEYMKLKAQINAAVKSLDKSIDTEIVQYFDKSRDLKLGSAPTDVLSILGTVGAVGWFLGKADNKDERISASLKYGIPAVGAIATSLYCTARLISGGKSMAFGLISGLLMNKIGEVVDNTRKKYSLDISLQNKTILKPQSDTV